MPKVSIIVPCWGVEKYLDRCVESLVNQTLKDIEIILVDDESPDKVPQMCDEWAKRDARIKVIHKKNAGLGMACNSGIEIASGEFVAFCDSDDWVDTEMYQILYNTAISEQCDVVYSGLRDVTENEVIISTRIKNKEKIVFSKEQINDVVLDMIAPRIEEKPERKYEASAKVALYKRKLICLNSIRFVSEREIASEDQIFNINVLLNSNKVCFLPMAFYNYRVNTNSISRSVNLDKWKAIKGMYNYMLDDCKKKHIHGDYDLRIQRVFLGSIRIFLTQVLNSNLSKQKINSVLRGIRKDCDVEKVLELYPISKMPIIQRYFTFCLKYRLFFGLKLFAVLKKM